MDNKKKNNTNKFTPDLNDLVITSNHDVLENMSYEYEVSNNAFHQGSDPYMEEDVHTILEDRIENANK